MHTHRTIAAVLAFISAILLVALLFGVSGQSAEITVLSLPGRFLFGAFSFGAFYIPLYLLFGAFLLLRNRFNRRDVVTLTASILPFLTASLACKTAFETSISPTARPFVLVFGRIGGSVLLFLFTILLTLLIISVRRQFRATRPGVKNNDSMSQQQSKERVDIDPSVDEAQNASYGGIPFRPILESSRFFTVENQANNVQSRVPVGETLNSETSGNEDSKKMLVSAESRLLAESLTIPIPDESTTSVPEPTETANVDSPSKSLSFVEDATFEYVSGEYETVNEPSVESPASAASAATAAHEAIDVDVDEVVEKDVEITAADLGDDVDDAIIEHTLDDDAPDDDASDDDASDDGVVEVADEPVFAYEAIDEDEEEPAATEELDLEIDDEVDIGGNEVEVEAEAEVESEENEEGEDPEVALVRDGSKTGKVSTISPDAPYDIPLDGLLEEYSGGQYWKIDSDTQEAADILKSTLEEFKINADVTGIRKGPVITMFEMLPAPGVKLSKIVNLADNIALRLAASRVRIVAPIPGKHAVGIEVPNRNRAIVSFREMILDDAFSDEGMAIPIALGKDIPGEAQIIDLTKTPHLLIAGATGSGKSVCVNSIISSILYRRRPSEVRLLLIDPKIVELKLYNDIPHLLTPVITEPKRAFQALQYCLSEMERRYSLLDALGVRDIASYNRKIKKKRLATLPIPYIVIVVDEFADLMANLGKDLETTLARLAAMSRAVGIHLVLATQRPSVDVITGLIKANIPSRIAFMVASKFDSRIIIDSVGAEKLLGRGDMLLTTAWNPIPIRIQGAFLSEDEVEQVTEHIKTLGKPDYIDDEIFIDDEDEASSYYSDGEADPLMSEALEIVVRAGKASASYLQRKLKIGYNRAARLVEDMEERGIVGPPQGSKPREVLRVPD